MPWVEGVGDEVTITLTVLLGLCILLAAWFSTGTRDIPFISVIIVQLRRRVGQANQALSSAAGQSDALNRPESEPAPNSVSQAADQDSIVAGQISETNATRIADTSHTSIPAEITNSEESRNAGAVSTSDTNVCRETVKSETDVEEAICAKSELEAQERNSDEETEDNDSNLSESELRRRRLHFFSGNSDSGVKTDNKDGSEGAQEKTVSAKCVPNADAMPNVSSDSSHIQDVAENFETRPDSVGTEGLNRPEQESRAEIDRNESQNEVGSIEPRSTEEIRVRIKFFNDTQKLVTSHPHETIGNFRQKHFPMELSQSKLVRFIFNGQDLRNDSSTLQSYNIIDNSVLHCLITQPRQQEQQQQHDDEDGLDIGMFMFPLFGLLLVILWYVRLMYKQFFNAKSTLVLAGMSFMYLAALMPSFRRQRARPAHEHLD